MGVSNHRTECRWTTRGSQLVYQNDWIRVHHRNVITPGGEPGVYGVVGFRHRAVGVLALDERDQIVLVGQYRYPLAQFSWEIPEGGCPPSEQPISCAKRELREETGIEANCWRHMLSLHLSNSVTDEAAEIFMATDIQRIGEVDRESSEADMRVKKVTLSEALAMVDRGDITDAISVAAILRAERIIRN